MTEDQTTSRPPCFKFKKGACRKGKGCRFSHDLGFQPPSRAGGYSDETSSAEFPSEPDPSSSFGNTSNKRRHGVTNTMLPAKKAKPALDSQRAKERPWTVKK